MREGEEKIKRKGKSDLDMGGREKVRKEETRGRNEEGPGIKGTVVCVLALGASFSFFHSLSLTTKIVHRRMGTGVYAQFRFCLLQNHTYASLRMLLLRCPVHFAAAHMIKLCRQLDTSGSRHQRSYSTFNTKQQY